MEFKIVDGEVYVRTKPEGEELTWPLRLVAMLGAGGLRVLHYPNSADGDR